MDPEATTLNVSEVFCSPQGEGARVGEMSIFVRLQGCSAKYACATAGVECDTEFESGRTVTIDALLDEVNAFSPVGWIVWTGGEPLDQLTPDIVQWWRDREFKQALETSGVKPFPAEFRCLFDWIACSPKVAEHILVKHFGDVGPLSATRDRAHVHELRYVRHKGQSVPSPALTALTYYLSPHSDGFTINRDNVRHVIELCRKEPRWKISIQTHKILGCL